MHDASDIQNCISTSDFHTSMMNMQPCIIVSKCELYWCQLIIIHVLLLSKPDEYTCLRCEPIMTDLMNEIAVKLPDKWRDIGRGLGLEEYELTQIEVKHGWEKSTNAFFSSVFNKWYNGE